MRRSRLLRILSVVLLVGAGLVATAPPASATGGPIAVDRPVQLHSAGYYGNACLQFVSAVPSYVTLTDCLPSYVSWTQLWRYDSVTRQISVAVAVGTRYDSFCLSSPLYIGYQGPGGSGPVQVAPCAGIGTPAYAAQVWDSYANTAPWPYSDLQNRATKTCLSASLYNGMVVASPCASLFYSDTHNSWQGWSTIDPTQAVGGFVWQDVNGNGIKDADEAGLPGVRVHLLDANGVPFSPDRTMLTSNSTYDGVGHYQFYAPPGTYFVQVDIPSGYTVTTKHAPGSSAANDSDVDASGRSDAVVLQATDITRTPGADTIKINAGLVGT